MTAKAGKLHTVSSYGKEGIIGYTHWCPGCNNPHFIRTVDGGKGEPIWTFNESLGAPTFSPSILVYHPREGGGGRQTICHYFLREGRIEFCGDSAHRFAGQTVELPDWPEEK